MSEQAQPVAGDEVRARSDEESRRDEARLLAEIGLALYPQDLRVRVQLPADLAARALAAWERDDDAQPVNEDPQEKADRHDAGIAALIGLGVRERGLTTAEGACEVVIDAWYVGYALAAAERRGLLDEIPAVR